MFRAVVRGNTVGAHLWYLHGEIAHSHLAAFSPLGYELMASYALYWFAIEYFADKVSWLNLGAGAGVESEGSDGLSRFKKGWATETRTAFFCGHVFNKAKYAEIVKAKRAGQTSYFPAYRKGEFG
jgi:lipid II:glycine glycyltransferase (peptidoglycan interpeptide bridge formation enzyme)